MNWQNHFGEVFFSAWKEEGLPDSEKYVDQYLTHRQKAVFQSDFISEAHNTVPALEANLLNSVYGFGSLHGFLFGELFGLGSKNNQSAADWCGRFNLGISLFDYVMDETPQGLQRILNLEALSTFTSVAKFDDQGISLTEDFLNHLIQDILNDVCTIDEKNEPDIQLMPSLQELFRAQLFLSNQNLKEKVDLKDVYNALYCKSAKPFGLMAEYVKSNSDNLNNAMHQRAKEIGTAIGACYWLIDDAKDIWVDFEHDEWNLFLHQVAQQKPKLFSSAKFSTSDIESFLITHQCAEKLSKEIINNLLGALRKLCEGKRSYKDEVGLMGGALFHWYNS
jgi:hypothetical protein